MPTNWSWETLLFSCAVVLPVAAPAADPQITRGPYVQAVLASSAQVLWSTDLPSTGKVRLKGEGGSELVAGETEASLDHRVRLEGLAPGSIQTYRVFDGDRVLHDEAFAFRTAQASWDGSVRAAVLGDSGFGTKEQIAVADIIRSLKPELILHTGDLDYTGSLDFTFFELYRDLLESTACYVVRGNHDTHHEWNALFPPPNENPQGKASYYSFDWGCAHFTCFDTNDDALTAGDQLRWVDEDLGNARARGAKWLVLFCHEPPFTVGVYADSPNIKDPDESLRKARRLIPPLADKHGIDLVLSGHDHNYQRSHPIRGDAVVDAWHSPHFVSPGGTIYVVTGGGGAALYAENLKADHQFTRLFVKRYHALELLITPEKLSLQALSPGLGQIDAFTIVKEGPRPEFKFIRGDANFDGTLNLADAVRILAHLFLGDMLECALATDFAADANASGEVGLDDAVHVLNFLFLGGPPPAQPFPDCGTAPGADEAGCRDHGCRGR